MTYAETAKVMAVLHAVYPNFYRNAGADDAAALVGLWAELFADDDYAAVNAAVKALIASDEKGFPPTAGAVRAKIRQLTQPQELSPQEAWTLVVKAVRNGYYGAAEEFEKLPPEVQRVVGSPAQLKEWSDFESTTLHSVVASNFQRSYAQKMQQKKEYDALPGGLKQLVLQAQQPRQDQLPTGFIKMIGG